MLKPLNGRVLVDPDEIPEATEYGIILNDKRKEKPVTGTVIVGGELVKKHDRVVFSKFGYDEVTLNKRIYFLVSELNLLAILGDNDA